MSTTPPAGASSQEATAFQSHARHAMKFWLGVANCARESVLLIEQGEAARAVEPLMELHGLAAAAAASMSAAARSPQPDEMWTLQQKIPAPPAHATPPAAKENGHAPS